FQVPGGLLGDLFGGRTVLTLLVLVWSLVTAAVALVAFLPANVGLLFAALLIMRFLFGAFQAGGFPVIGRIVADWMPVAERGFAQGTIWMLSRLGGFLVPFLIVWLFRWSGGLADSVRRDWQLGAGVVRRVLALVSQPAGGNDPRQPRRVGTHRRRP